MIALLEDSEDRVTWLRSLVGADLVYWFETTSALLAHNHLTRPELALVILDHDLGLSQGNAIVSDGPDGLTGLHAAERMPVVPCPVLVWSLNPVRAPRMLEVLRRRGMRSAWAPFGSVGCTAFIEGVLAKGAA